MALFVLKRILRMIPVVIGTTFLLYAAVYSLPGDPVQTLAGNQTPSPSFVAAVRAQYHLNDSLLVQYYYYLTGLLHGDLGVDLNGVKVSDVVRTSWPVTLTLALSTWVIEVFFGLLIGTWAAVRHGKAADLTVLGVTTLLLGVPYFVSAYVAQIVFGVKLHWLPVSGIAEGWPTSYILPACMLALIGLPVAVRITRSSVLENRSADHVDTALAKGLASRVVIRRHVLRNSLIPVVSVLGLSLGYLLSGTVLIEGIFNVPGLGFQIYQAIRAQNAPLVVGISTLLVIVFLVINLIVDILYGVLDPRIRVE